MFDAMVEANDSLRAEVARLRTERDLAMQRTNVVLDDLIAAHRRTDALAEALRGVAALVDGQEGRTAQTMMMHGFSPVKALGQARDIALAALSRLGDLGWTDGERHA